MGSKGTTTTNAERGQAALPDSLHRYFWEYGSDQLTLDSSRYTILKRLLEAGGWDAVNWLRANVDDDELRGFIVRRQGRGINPKRLRFWGLVLGLPRSQVDQWIAAQGSNPWARRTPR